MPYSPPMFSVGYVKYKTKLTSVFMIMKQKATTILIIAILSLLVISWIDHRQVKW
jgi:hypothetical protein